MLEITPEKAYEEILSGRAIGIDVREADEWVAGHSPLVSWNPKSAFDINAMPKQGAVILICRSGNRSGQVAEAFSDHNSQIFNMVGGMKAWHASGLPMESENGNPEVA